MRQALITHNQDVDEAIEALYESEYQDESHQVEPANNLDHPTTDEAASPSDKLLSDGTDHKNEDEGPSQDSGVDEKRKRKRISARDRKMRARNKQKLQRKTKKADDEQQQEAKVTSELRQLYIWKTYIGGYLGNKM